MPAPGDFEFAGDDDDSSLERFVKAQSACFSNVVCELQDGAKTSHWMWFVFPQYRGLGTTGISRKYAIVSLSEARAYLVHPILGSRLRQCSELVLAQRGRSARQMFGLDDIKLRSSMTLFELADGISSAFSQVLLSHFAGDRDGLTIDLVNGDLPIVPGKSS